MQLQGLVITSTINEKATETATENKRLPSDDRWSPRFSVSVSTSSVPAEHASCFPEPTSHGISPSHWVPVSAAAPVPVMWSFHHSECIHTQWPCHSQTEFNSLSVLTDTFPGEPGLAGFSEANDDGSGGNDCIYKSCKGPVKSTPPTNQHPTFHRLDALPVYQPTLSQH